MSIGVTKPRLIRKIKQRCDKNQVCLEKNEESYNKNQDCLGKNKQRHNKIEDRYDKKHGCQEKLNKAITKIKVG